MAGANRDPVSEHLDQAARTLLDRVYKAEGAWASTRLRDPTPGEVARWFLRGISVLGPDPVPMGGLHVRTRWARSYVRALWHQHQWWSGDPATGGWRATRRTTQRRPGIQIEVARWAPPRGVIPAGRPVRVRLADKEAAEARGRPEAEWSWSTGDRRAQIEDRDWPALGDTG